MKAAVALLALTTAIHAVGSSLQPDLIASQVGPAKGDGKPDFLIDIRNTLLWTTKHRCNGVLIDAKWILAPAGCVRKAPWYGKFVIVVRSRKVGFQKIIIHEKANSINNDIALIRLKDDVMDIMPVTLPPTGFNYSGQMTLYTRDKKDKVQSFTVGVQPNSMCKGSPPLHAIHICAGDKKNSTVKGQEGSVLTVSDPSQGTIIVGYLTWVKKDKGPAAYTRVSNYTRWIMNKMTAI